jgi:type I restriction enzyme R subunit
LQARLESGEDSSKLLNLALEDVLFTFTKLKEAELVLADQLKNTLRKTRETLLGNFDPQDPKFITLKEELERLFKNKKLNEVGQAEINANIGALNAIQEKAQELNRQNDLIRAKYQGDAKYARIHKRLWEHGALVQSERGLFEVLTGIKTKTDDLVLQNTQLLTNESYFAGATQPFVIGELKTRLPLSFNRHTAQTINQLLVAEYRHEFSSGNRTGA